jgi:hypothetical protein
LNDFFERAEHGGLAHRFRAQVDLDTFFTQDARDFEHLLFGALVDLLRRLSVVAAGVEDDVIGSGEVTRAGGCQQARVALFHQLRSQAVEVDEVRRVDAEGDLFFFGYGFDLRAGFRRDPDALHPGDFEMLQPQLADMLDSGRRAAGGRCLRRTDRAKA